MKVTNELALPAAGYEPDCRIGKEDLPFVKEFIAEAMQHVEAAEASVLMLEKDPRNKEAVETLFRSFHTIHGSAGFLHLQQFGKLAHAAENMLNQVRRGSMPWADSTIELALDSIDLLKTMIVALEESARRDAPLARQERLPALLQRLRVAETVVAAEQVAVTIMRMAQPQLHAVPDKATSSERGAS